MCNENQIAKLIYFQIKPCLHLRFMSPFSKIILHCNDVQPQGEGLVDRLVDVSEMQVCLQQNIIDKSCPSNTLVCFRFDLHENH